MIPTAVINGDKTDANFDKPSRKQQPLRKIIATVRLADLVRFLADIERFLRFLRMNKLKRLAVKIIEGYGGIISELVVITLHAIERLAHFETRLRAAFGDLLR